MPSPSGAGACPQRNGPEDAAGRSRRQVAAHHKEAAEGARTADAAAGHRAALDVLEVRKGRDLDVLAAGHKALGLGQDPGQAGPGVRTGGHKGHS